MGDIAVAARVWRCVPRPGREHCRLLEDGLAGDVVIDDNVFSYRVIVDAQWRTRSLRVEGWVGASPFTFALEAPLPEGCIDVDLGFTPSTNTLPIRRLALSVGEEARVCRGVAALSGTHARASRPDVPAHRGTHVPIQQRFRVHGRAGGGRARAGADVRRRVGSGVKRNLCVVIWPDSCTRMDAECRTEFW